MPLAGWEGDPTYWRVENGAIVGYNSVALRLPSADATFVAVSNESTNFTTPSTDLIMLPIMQYLYPSQFR